MSHVAALTALSCMRTTKRALSWAATLALLGCGNESAVVLQSLDGSSPIDSGTPVAASDSGGDTGLEHDAGVKDSGSADASDAGEANDASCFTTPFPHNPPASWATSDCLRDAGGCPFGTVCMVTGSEATFDVGCVPIPSSCGGSPTCDCMGCVCALGGCSAGPTSMRCSDGTVSRRAFKDDIAYVSDEERPDLAHQALEIPLARYRYKTEPADARRRLGFLIDDQPDPSPAVASDRTHVDEYGYTSMLLATVQQQAKEIDALRLRVDALEHRRDPSHGERRSEGQAHSSTKRVSSRDE